MWVTSDVAAGTAKNMTEGELEVIGKCVMCGEKPEVHLEGHV